MCAAVDLRVSEQVVHCERGVINFNYLHQKDFLFCMEAAKHEHGRTERLDFCVASIERDNTIGM